MYARLIIYRFVCVLRTKLTRVRFDVFGETYHLRLQGPSSDARKCRDFYRVTGRECWGVRQSGKRPVNPWIPVPFSPEDGDRHLLPALYKVTKTSNHYIFTLTMAAGASAKKPDNSQNSTRNISQKPKMCITKSHQESRNFKLLSTYRFSRLVR